MYCESCGKETSPESSFCGYCGARVTPSIIPQPPTSTATPPTQPETPPTVTPKMVKRSHLLLVSATLSILLIILSGALIIQVQQYSNLQAEYNALQARYITLNSQYDSLNSQYQSSQAQVTFLLQQNNALTTQVQQLTIQLRNPTLTIWTAPVTVSSGTTFLYGGVPDTFDYLVDFTSTVSFTVYFLSGDQFVQYYNCATTPRINCVTGTWYWIPTTTSASNWDFMLAEGCAGYLAIYQPSAAGTIYPNVRVYYNPASHPTGVC